MVKDAKDWYGLKSDELEIFRLSVSGGFCFLLHAETHLRLQVRVAFVKR